MNETYQQDGSGGYYVIKGGARAGSIPAGHSLVAQIEARAEKRQVTVLGAAPENITPEPAAPTLAEVIAVLIDKKLIAQSDLDVKVAAR